MLFFHFSKVVTGGNTIGALWRRVRIGHPSNEDLQSIVKSWHPELEPLAGKLIGAVDPLLIIGFRLLTL